MGLTFLHPAFLLGTLATAVPVIIHLISRRRALVHRFPTVRFLLLADKRTAQKFRLYHWLLLALRILAVLLLALVLARPRLIGSKAQAAGIFPAQATVVLVDNSLSMQYRDGQETRLQRAKAVAARLLQALRPSDSAAILPLLTADRDAETAGFLTHDQTTLRQQLTAIRTSYAKVDLGSVFQRAFALLNHSSASRHRLVLLSDFTVYDWEGFHLSQLSVIPEGIELHFMRLGGPHRDANILVEGVRIVDPPFIEGVPLEVTAMIRNRSAETVRNLRVALLLERTKIGEQLVTLGPDEQVTVPFRMTAPASGLHWGAVRLESDRFPEDDRWYFALRTVAPAHVLLVDGDPGTSLFDSEIFYLMSALQPSAALGHPLFYPKPVPWEGLSHERLSDYRVVVLCNVEALTSQVRQRLYQFVTDGGGVLFFAGNRVDATRYNAMFYRSDTLLLPLPLGQPVHHQKAPLTIGSFEPTHEALKLFTDHPALLRRGKFYRYLAIHQPPPTSDVHVLLSLQDGQPLLVEKRRGRGRVMFFASTADRDWTDLPTRTAYVPLLYGILGHLARLSSATQRPGIAMPQPISLIGRQVDLERTVTFHTPDGRERFSRYVADGRRVVARFAAYTVPGLYHVTTPSGPDLLAVNAPRTESNFDKLQAADLQSSLRPLTLVMEEEAQSEPAPVGSQGPGKELSGILMLALVAVLVVENVCANRF